MERAKELCATTDATIEKTQIYESLVTKEAANNFKSELEKLGALKVPVELMKVRGSKGKVLYKLQLHEAQRSTSLGEVLSEGEQRVISLAAFLSDNSISQSKSPLIFDDPVSSLDHHFESLVAKRLHDIGKHRQVIVFTHRLAFANELESIAASTKSNFKLSYVSSTHRGTGHFRNDAPFKLKNPVKLLNNLVNEQISKVKKLEREDRFDEVDIGRSAIMKYAREIIELIIEEYLCGGVVKRFAKEIRISNVHRLHHATREDCEFLEMLIDKYSHEIHSQPSESPYILPAIEEVETDLNLLKDWVLAFQTRAGIS